MAPSRKTLPKAIIRLGWISFFADICSEMVYPLIPLFLKNTLQAPVRAMGIIEGFAEGIVSIMKGWSGLHSDQTGKRTPYIRWGYGLSGIAKPLLGLATIWPMVFFARAMDRVGKGVRTTARDALLTDLAGPDQRGRAFGLHRGMDTAGALVGVGIAYMLMQLIPGQYRTAFLLAGIPGMISLWLAFKVPEPPSDPEPIQANPDQPKPIISLKQVARSLPRDYWIALGIACLFALANSSDTFLLLQASRIGLTDAQVIGAYACYNVTYMLASYPCGVLSDRFGRWALLVPGWMLYALVYWFFGTVTPGLIWFLFALYGVSVGMTKGVGAALIADHAPPEIRGSAMGLFHMVSGFAVLGSNAVAGILWDVKGPQWTFGAGAAFAVIGVLAVPFAARGTKRLAD